MNNIQSNYGPAELWYTFQEDVENLSDAVSPSNPEQEFIILAQERDSHTIQK